MFMRTVFVALLLAAAMPAWCARVLRTVWPDHRRITFDELTAEIKTLEKQMREAAKALEFEKAAELRDRLRGLRSREFGLK